MTEDREIAILEQVKKKAKDLEYGELVVKFTIHNKKITKGEVILKTESLG